MAISSAPYAFVTLISSDSYLPGALALVAALKDVHPTPPVPPETNFQTVCLVTPETVDVSVIKLLRRAFDIVIGVEIIEDQHKKGLELLGRPDLNTVLTKLHAFRLTQFSKIIFVDADVLPIQPLSHLFSIDHEFSAVPDVGWPDIFNSGMMVFAPGDDKFQELSSLLKAKGTWDGGDQGLLNEWRGNNWNRLSFTYNTTPTAAYTYAPAYERFGSQISAIHFIGPNKPWNSIAYRAPGTSHTQPSDSQTYDYASLVDRWYSVYDTHYRSEPVPLPEFNVQRYDSVWNVEGGPNSDFSSTKLPGASGGSILDLEELRKIAVEGLAKLSSTSVGRSGEGEYWSMPLEGRVDLMRPKVEPVYESESESTGEPRPQSPPGNAECLASPITVLHIPPPEHGVPLYMRTLQTPAPHEIPPTPNRHILTLPPTPLPGGQLDQQQEPHSEPWSHHQEQSILQFPRLENSSSHHTPIPQSEDSQSPYQYAIDVSNEPLIDVAKPPQSRRRHPPPSPPLLPWNPAVEPPPKTSSGISALPSDTYFPNIWDQAPSKLHDATHQFYFTDSDTGHSHSVDWRASVFFNPPPLSEIPESLILEGHYANVTGPSDGSANLPVPNPMKVNPIFPWEEKPRHMPRRVFPETDAPPPGTFLGREKRYSPPSNLSTDAAAHHLPSPIGLPVSLNYVNAWDTVPSIQSYASRLVRPHHRSHHRSASSYQTEEWKKLEREKFSPWKTKEEESSMDGDDEDDETDARDSGKNSKQRSRSGSDSSTPQGSTHSYKGKKYRSRGVQTIPKETRSLGVQVGNTVGQGHPTNDPRFSMTNGASLNGLGGDQQGTSLSPTYSRAASVGYTPPMSSSPGYRSPRTLISPRNYSPPKELSLHRMPFPRTSPLGGLSPRKDISPPLSGQGPGIITSVSSVGVHLQPSAPSIKPVPGLDRSVSFDTTISSPGPNSPADASPSLSQRKTGRVWDPARGVEIFKRDSEEVLSRFLKMGSFE